MKRNTKKTLSPAEAKIFGLSEDLAQFAEISDRQDTEAGSLVVVKTVNDYKNLYVQYCIANEPTKFSTPTRIAQLEQKPCELDSFDGGIVYLMSPYKDTAKIICKTFDSPKEESIAPALIDKRFAEMDDGSFYAWGEGTIIRIFTLNGQTYYSTRSKLDCSRSKCLQEPNCPTIKRMFDQHCTNNGIKHEIFETEGETHVFLLRDPWNQITRTGVEKSELIHLASYNFAGDYTECESSFDKVQEKKKLTSDEAKELVRSGGIVLRADGCFVNTKIMSVDTFTLYQTLRMASIAPVLEYYKLLSKDSEVAARMLATINKFCKEKIEIALENESEFVERTVDWLYWRLQLRVKNKEVESLQKTDKRMDNAMKAVTIAFATAKDEFHGQKGNYKKKFIWGGNASAQEQNSRNVLREHIMELKQNDGNAFYCLMRDCKKAKQAEDHRQEKLKGNAPVGGVLIATEEELKQKKKNNKKNKPKK